MSVLEAAGATPEQAATIRAHLARLAALGVPVTEADAARAIRTRTRLPRPASYRR